MLVVIESCGKANALNSVGRNVHFLRTGALLSHEQVHYTNQLRERVAAALAANDDDECKQHLDQDSGPDKLLIY